MAISPIFDSIDSTLGWDLLSSNKLSVLIDVRTYAEWSFVGIPDLDGIGKNLIQIEFLTFPAMQINQNFKNAILERITDKNTALLFICRSGGRSASAAELIANEGYNNCYNIIDGFEGDLNMNGRRGNINGWKFNNLPWRQT